MLRFFLCMLVVKIGGFTADNAGLKLPLNMPVFYQLHVEGDVKTEGKDPKMNFKTFTMDLDFSIIVKNEHEYFPEMILIPTKLQGLLKFNHGNAVFDLAKENLTFNHILEESFPVLTTIKLNQPIRIPLSDNIEFLSDIHPNYPFLPVNNPNDYVNLSKKILDIIANGLPVKQGRGHAEIPELGIEIFSNEKNVEDQIKGDYDIRFLMPLDRTKSVCIESLMGGGKIKNSTLKANILTNNAKGLFILIYQRMDCPKKEANERYEIRGKLTLTPKIQEVSALTKF